MQRSMQITSTSYEHTTNKHVNQ